MPSSGPSVPSNFCGERGWTHEQGPLLSQEPSTLNTKPESYPRVIFGMFFNVKRVGGRDKDRTTLHPLPYFTFSPNCDATFSIILSLTFNLEC